jgi:hypothetical protein
VNAAACLDQGLFSSLGHPIQDATGGSAGEKTQTGVAELFDVSKAHAQQIQLPARTQNASAASEIKQAKVAGGPTF